MHAKIKSILDDKTKLLTIGLVGIVIVSLLSSFHFYSKYKRLTGSDENSEVKILLEQISHHMILPEEFPTVATVSDREKLEKRPFFNNADNGDKVLIFSQSRKAVLYRPSEDKIVDVAPIQLTTDNQSDEPIQLTAPQESNPSDETPTEESSNEETEGEDNNVEENPSEQSTNDQEFSIVLLNGTPKVGITHKLETELLSEFPNSNIEKKSSANRDNYNETLVISNTDNGDNVIGIVGNIFNAKPSDVPNDEKTYDADIVIIVGKDNI